MSQFAAHEQAGRPATSRTAELTREPGGEPHRGSAQGFRKLKERLKGPVDLPAAKPLPPPHLHRPTPPLIEKALEGLTLRDGLGPPRPSASPEPAEIREAAADVPAALPQPDFEDLANDTDTFDLSSLFASRNAPSILGLSAIDTPAADLLLENASPPPAWRGEPGPQALKNDHAPTVAGDHPPAQSDNSSLKHLRQPDLPAIDEFALNDQSLAAPEQNAPDSELGLEAQAHDRPGASAVQAPPFWAPNPEDADLSPEAEAPAEPAMPATPLASPPEPGPEPSLSERKPEADSRKLQPHLRQPSEIESEEAGEVASSLLEIMSLPANATQPQERALAADSLLHLIHRLPLKSLVMMVERLSLMEQPPPLILAELIHDPRIEVAGPLLEKCPAIHDQDLLAVIADAHQHNNRMIARRRILTSVICDALIATQDTSAILILVRNPGASISHEAFFKLNEIARQHSSLQAPLATRADLPAPVAFELFWVLPVELRRYVISRFLTDSTTLNKILKLTQRMDQDQQEPAPPRFAPPQEIDRLCTLLLEGDKTGAEQLMSSLLGLGMATAARIISDTQGEPLAVALKAAGAMRADFERLFTGTKDSPDSLRLAVSPADLQAFFETLSFNKARVLLTYWDWAVLRTGPYAGLIAQD